MRRLHMAGFIALIGILTAGLALPSYTLTSLEDRYTLSWLFELRGPIPAPADAAVIGINSTAAARMQLPVQPVRWSRATHAGLIDRLSEHDVSVVAFDLFFQEPRDDDAILAKSLARSRRIVLFQRLQRHRHGELYIDTLANPTPLLARAAAGLAPFPLPKIPVRIDRFWAFYNGVPTLPVVALQLHALHRLPYADFRRLFGGGSLERELPSKIGSATDLRQLMLALRARLHDAPGRLATHLAEDLAGAALPDATSRALVALVETYSGPDYRYLDLYGPAATVTTLDYDRVPSSGEPETLAGKAVFIGVSEIDSSDQADGFHTVFTDPDGVDLNGVEIAATAFLNLLYGQSLRPLGPVYVVVLLLSTGVILALLTVRLPGYAAVVASLGFGTAYLALAYQVFIRFQLLWPLFSVLAVQLPVALLLGLLLQYLITRFEKRRMLAALRQLVPSGAAQRLEQDGSLQAPEEVFATCLVSDVQGYTTLAEKLNPRRLTTLTNAYFDLLLARVRAHGGELLGIYGDGMTCAWPTPQPERESRLRACLAALDIQRALAGFNREHADHPFETRIGLHAGWVAIGALGGSERFSFGVAGDIVYTASRLEGLNKHLGTRILAEATVVDDLDELLLRPLGWFQLKGKNEAVTVFEIASRQAKADENQRQLCEHFGSALADYHAGKNSAVAAFEAILEDHPLDGPTLFYLRHCRQTPDRPPIIRLEIK